MRRVVIAAILAVVLAISGAQMVLWSDVPRRVLIAAIERQLGLKVLAESVSTGWFGRTTLRDVSIELPLAAEPVLRAQLVRVSHTWPIAMLLGRSIRIERLELERSELTIRQGQTGAWNLQEAYDLIAGARGQSPAPGDSGRPSAGSLPIVLATGVTVHVVDLTGREAHIFPLDISAGPEGQLVYRFSASCPQRLNLSGTLVPGGTWPHEAQITVANADEWIRALAPAWPVATKLDARWRGQRGGDGVKGRLEIASLQLGDTAARGTVDATASGSSLSLRPVGLLVTSTAPFPDEANATGGTIVLDARALSARGLRLETGEGNIEINGSWDRVAQTADARAVWRNLRLPAGAVHSGSLNTNLQTGFPNRPQIEAELTSTGNLETAGRWDAHVTLHGEGDSFGELSWRATLGRATYDWKRHVDLSGLSLVGRSLDWRVLVLDDVAIPGSGRLTGRGSADLEQREWWLWLSGGDFPLPRAKRSTLAFEVNAWGAFNGATIDKVFLAAGDVNLWMTGDYDRRRGEPLVFDAWLTHLPPLGEDNSAFIRGRLRSELHLAGTSPLDLKVSGQLHGRELYFRGRSLGDVTARLSGQISTDWLHIETHQLDLLGAHWDLTGRWPTLDAQKEFELIVQFDGLPLQELDGVLGNPKLRGTASGRLDMKIPSLRMDELVADGSVAVSGIERIPFRADSLRSTLSIRNGRLRLDQIELQEGAGRATATAEADLARLAIWSLTASISDWPLSISETDGSVTFSADTTQLQIDLSRRAVFGAARLRSELTRGGSRVGAARLELSADGRALRISEINGDLLGGEIRGVGKFDLDHPLQTTASLDCRNIDAARLRDWFPRFGTLSGIFNAELRAGSAEGPYPLAPLQVGFKLNSSNGAVGTVPLRSLDLTAYLKLDQPIEKLHLVTPNAKLQVADGEADLFARLTLRNDDTLAAMISGSFERLNLDQIVHAVVPDADPMLGRLSGNLMIAGNPALPRDLFGNLTVHFTESDLINFDPMGFLYAAMHAGESRGPSGTGTIRARLDNRNLEITSLYGRNRGLEVRGAGSIGDIFALPDCTLSGMLVGTTRPLKDIRLPFFANLDQMLTALQSNATTVQVSGTLREPKTRLTTFDQMGDNLRTLLIGDVRGER